MTMSAQRVTWLYDLMDSAYDANVILEALPQPEPCAYRQAAPQTLTAGPSPFCPRSST